MTDQRRKSLPDEDFDKTVQAMRDAEAILLSLQKHSKALLSVDANHVQDV